jgi:hypothetical protein
MSINIDVNRKGKNSLFLNTDQMFAHMRKCQRINQHHIRYGRRRNKKHDAQAHTDAVDAVAYAVDTMISAAEIAEAQTKSTTIVINERHTFTPAAAATGAADVAPQGAVTSLTAVTYNLPDALATLEGATRVVRLRKPLIVNDATRNEEHAAYFKAYNKTVSGRVTWSDVLTSWIFNCITK